MHSLERQMNTTATTKILLKRTEQKKYQTFGASKQAGQFSGITGSFAYNNIESTDCDILTGD